MGANHHWVIVKRATMATHTAGGIYLPGAESKPVCYGIITEVGPDVPDNISVGDIAWFDAQWQESFSLDQEGKESVSALPYHAIYRTDTVDGANAMGAKLTPEMVEMAASLAS